MARPELKPRTTRNVDDPKGQQPIPESITSTYMTINEALDLIGEVHGFRPSPSWVSGLLQRHGSPPWFRIGNTVLIFRKQAEEFLSPPRLKRRVIELV